jgi:hypothetical protein
VPGYANPQNLNRMSYANNNPLRYTDPSGHRACDDVDAAGNCITAPGGGGMGFGGVPKNPRGGGGSGGSGGSGSNVNACSGPNPSIVCLPTPTPGVEKPNLPAVNSETNPAAPNIPDLKEFDAWAWFTDKALKVIDYASSYEDIVNTFKPTYKQVKYAVGTGGLEAVVDGIIYGLHDRWDTTLTPAQRVERVLVVSGESLIVDRGSQVFGLAGTPFGGQMGEVALQYIFSAAVTEHVVPSTTYYLFDKFNLGVPYDLRPIK